MAQQTAVDFIIKSIKDRNEDGFRLVGSFLNPILEQAKQMEKKQIVKAHGDRYDRDVDEIISGEQYYYINYVYQGTDDTIFNNE